MAFISSIFSFFGGLGMFLYGMTTMSDGMQRAASSRMSKFLSLVTGNRVMAVLLGAVITALIQSSSATTVMVVGFVNAGLLNLYQAVGIIMGANVGTTITAWMVSLTQVSSGALVFLKPDFFAPLLVGYGAFRMLIGKKGQNDAVGAFCVGIGLIFIGLGFMSDAVGPYVDSPIFSKAFQVMGSNPVLGVLAGTVVTALIQSSSASVSILQTLALAGSVPRAAGFYITLGQNIGTCITAMLSSTGASRTAKRAAAIHLLFNVAGTLLFGSIIFITSFFLPQFFQGLLTPVEISIFHTVFNVSCTVVLFHAGDFLVYLSGKLVPESRADREAMENPNGYTEVEKGLIKHLDTRILESPAIALQATYMEVCNMGELAAVNVDAAMDLLISGDISGMQAVVDREQVIDNVQKLLTDYLIRIDNLSLTESQKLMVTNLFNAITDIERVGDHASNIAEQAQYVHEHEKHFSEIGINDLRKISGKALESFRSSITAMNSRNLEDVFRTARFEDEVDELEEEMRERHLTRLTSGECEPQSGVVFLDVISDLERISDHADNIAGYVKATM